MTNCDLAVVGGSFAGLSCATQAAANGLNTHVFEQKIWPGAYTQSTQKQIIVTSCVGCKNSK